MIDRFLIAVLLACGCLVPAGVCGSPAQRPSRTTSDALAACSLSCDPATTVWSADGLLASARSLQHAAEAYPSQTRGAQLEDWIGIHGIYLALLALLAGVAGAVFGVVTLLFCQRAQRRRRRRQSRCKQQQQQQPQAQQTRRLRLAPPSQTESPWAQRRVSLSADSAPMVVKRPPLPPTRRHSLPAGLSGSARPDGSVLARVSSDVPSVTLGSPFASCAAQPGWSSKASGPSPAVGLGPAGSAACTAAAVLATAIVPCGGAASASLSHRSSGQSLGSACLNPSDTPAYSPSVRPSLEGCATPSPPSRLPPVQPRPPTSNQPGSAAPSSADDSPTQHSSTALPDGCLPTTPTSLAEQLAAEPGAPPTVPLAAPLDAGALPDALRGCLVHPSEICFLHWPGEPLQPLGEGASATVFRATLHGQEVAVKVMHVGHSVEAQRIFVREAARMQQLRHEHIVDFLGVSLDGPNAMLVMEYCAGHDLLSSLQLHADDSSERRLFGWWHRGRRVALQLAEALAHLHSLGIVHMDVKSSNVLLTARGGAKLADVGLSRLLEKTHLSAISCIGTFAWAAPEVLLGGHDCGRPADIYSFGVVLWELLTGERPVRGHLRLPRVPEECPQDVCDLMLRCLSTDPRSRPTADQLVTHLEAMVHFGPAQAPAAPCPAAQ